MANSGFDKPQALREHCEPAHSSSSSQQQQQQQQAAAAEVDVQLMSVELMRLTSSTGARLDYKDALRATTINLRTNSARCYVAVAPRPPGPPAGLASC